MTWTRPGKNLVPRATRLMKAFFKFLWAPRPSPATHLAKKEALKKQNPKKNAQNGLEDLDTSRKELAPEGQRRVRSNIIQISPGPSPQTCHPPGKKESPKKEKKKKKNCAEWPRGPGHIRERLGSQGSEEEGKEQHYSNLSVPLTSNLPPTRTKKKL